MRTIAGISHDIRQRDIAAEEPRSAALFDLRIHALIGAAQPRQRVVHILLRKAFAAHRQHEFPAQRL